MKKKLNIPEQPEQKIKFCGTIGMKNKTFLIKMRFFGMKILHLQFNLPTAQSPDPEKKNVQFEDGPIEMNGNFFENFTRILDGKVKDDAEYLIFEMVDLFRLFIEIKIQ